MAKAAAWVMIPTFDKDKTGCVIDIRPLVLCKDCKHRFIDGNNVKVARCELNHNELKQDEWFCADGEAKTNAAD